MTEARRLATIMALDVVVTVEALWGFTFFAFVTGLAFARFTRPTARVLFSNVASGDTLTEVVPSGTYKVEIVPATAGR